MDVLRVENLSLSVRNGEGELLSILDSVCMRLPEGMVTCLVGESGAGKTMLGRAMAALLPEGIEVASGSVFYREEALEFGRLKELRGKSIFYIPQDAPSALNPVLKLKRQFTDFGSFSRKELLDTLRRFGFDDPLRILHSYPFELSGGEAQRCLLAMAASRKPEVLILDEPFRSLDEELQIQAADYIQALQRESGMAVLVISHNVRMVKRIADFIYVIFQGKLIEEGTLNRLIASPRHSYSAELVQILNDNSY